MFQLVEILKLNLMFFSTIVTSTNSPVFNSKYFTASKNLGTTLPLTPCCSCCNYLNEIKSAVLFKMEQYKLHYNIIVCTIYYSNWTSSLQMHEKTLTRVTKSDISSVSIRLQLQNARNVGREASYIVRSFDNNHPHPSSQCLLLQ